MRSRNSSPVILCRVFGQVLKTSAVSGILSLLYDLIEGLFPAYTTAVSACLFEAAASYMTGRGDIGEAAFFSFLLVMGYGVRQLFQWISSITINAGVYEKVSSYSDRLLYETCAGLPLIRLEDAAVMDRKSRAADCVRREIISQLYMMSVSMVTSAVGVVSVILVLSSYSVLFLPVSLLSVFPYFIVRFIRGKQFYALKQHQVKKERRKEYLWSLFTDRQSVKEMRVMGFGDYMAQKWAACRDEVNEELWRLTKKDGCSLLVCDFIRIAGYGLCIWLAFLMIMKQQISFGVFGACIAAFASVQGQTKTFLIQLGNISEKLGYGRDYFDFIDEAAEEMDAGEGRREPIQKIEFKDVQFMYPNSVKKALEDLNITIHRGEKIAVVGENGSGKTTLTKLLLGMYDPCQGEIQVNGEDLLRRGKKDYQKRVSMISQQFVRYQMTLRENVAMSDLVRRGEDGQIEEALKSAGLEADFDAAALDTLLGTQFGSVDLSGGQWQRLAIARGIFRASEVIVMDEPTSAIDPIAEAEIFKKFLEIAEGKTAVIVSHRTGLCTMVDKIAVMKEGRLVEYGSHETLLGMDGEYARLFCAQRQWYV